MKLNRGDSKGKRYFGDISCHHLRFCRLGRPAFRDDRRQEYLPRLRPPAEGTDGTDAVRFDCSANCPRNEMTFESVGPSCYPPKLFSVLLEQKRSAGRSRDEKPAEDMHRAVSKISQVYVEICETAERIVASPPRDLGHGQ